MSEKINKSIEEKERMAERRLNYVAMDIERAKERIPAAIINDLERNFQRLIDFRGLPDISRSTIERMLPQFLRCKNSDCDRAYTHLLCYAVETGAYTPKEANDIFKRVLEDTKEDGRSR